MLRLIPPFRSIFLIRFNSWYNGIMETLDYDSKHWIQPCSKYDCKKNKCKCGLKYVNIPAVLGDDSATSSVAPKNGNYCNAIVKYEDNGHVYVYSSEGIPVPMFGGECHCLPNLVIDLPNGITEYARGKAPISYDEVKKAFEQGQSIFLKDFRDANNVYTISAFSLDDGIRSIKVERVGIGIDTAGFWLVQSDHSDSWENIHYFQSVYN